MPAKSNDIPFVGPMLRSIFGSRTERLAKKYIARVESITALEPEIRRLTDAELRAKTAEFQERFKSGERAADLMTEAFAVAREVMDRAVGIRNVFNPEHVDEFDADRLSPSVRELYDKTREAMEATEPAQPVGALRGSEEPVPGWQQLDIPVEIYEAVREIYPDSRPPFRARPFDVQLFGAMVLYQGKIAEMKTGEGKTIVAPLAAYLASIEGQKVHVVTVNDYLVQRDRDWTFPFFRAVGLTVGAIHPHHMQPEPMKREMYKCDVVYGTTSEFGFDYLRDNMKRSVDQQVQRRREFAIVDEVDSVLIDEARTPLIISGPAFEDAPRYELADQLARHLVEKQGPWQERDDAVQACVKRIKGLEGDIRNAREKDKINRLQDELKKARIDLPALEAERDKFTQYYELEPDKKQAHLTHVGIEEAQRKAGVGSFYVGENTDVPHLLEQSIRAHTIYQRDRDYVIMPLDNAQTGQKEPSVVIVDVFTGRLQIGRQWSDGLHQAIEAKEGVPIKQETQTIATVTIQNFFKMYERLAGMTGTADTEAQEFHDIYKLDVVVIPTNLPVIRRDFDDTVFLSGKDKWSAIVDEIKAHHDLGQPVLVGTTSVEKSEELSAMLTRKHGVDHEVLNAKQHEREAHIIEGAGRLGAVMIATNMAGRGTDIKLRAVPRDELLDHWKKRSLARRELTTESSDEEIREAVYRKVAPRELGLKKSEADSMDFEELELQLLRHWALEHTWVDPKKVDRHSADELRSMLDENARFRLHRIGWFDNVEKMGGLHVVGTERHESRRIDNQLRGRSGRQGDRGSSRFFVSLDDDLMKMFAGETTLKILSRLGMKEGDAIEHPMLTKSVERAQRKVEERNFQIRKQILEYDEVMEHQRQAFYGLRQRALEGREMKSLIFSYIEDAVADAVERYLDREYPLECIADHALSQLDVSIPPDRLRGVDRDEIEERIRKVAREEAAALISMTMAEYLSEETDEGEYDYTGLANWAQKEFGAELKPSELRAMSNEEVEQAFIDAAHERIESTDLSGVHAYLEPGYGHAELCKWAKNKFDFDLDPKELEKMESREDVIALVTGRARERYKEREIEYPVSFMMEMTMASMAQSPEQAAEGLVSWANRRFGLDWDASIVRTKVPKQIYDDLLKASREFVESNRVEEAVGEALALPDDAAILEFFTQRLGTPPPPRIFETSDEEEREAAIQASVEGALRAEMVNFERFVILEVLDSAWKEHLRGMDQLRDSIGYRAFSQKDPRIEFKREGARLFEEMQESVRDRLTDFIFKLRLRAQTAPQRPAPAEAAAQPTESQGATDGAPAGSPPPAAEHRRSSTMISGPGRAPAGGGSSTISGPGIRQPGAAGAARRSAGQPQGRPQAPSQRQSGEDAPSAAAAVAGASGTTARVGRNDPCPCGSGKKYKKCCGQNA